MFFTTRILTSDNNINAKLVYFSAIINLVQIDVQFALKTKIK